MTFLQYVAVLGAVTVAAACSPRDYETTPVPVQTAQGTVLCQLYTLNQVTWDRSIDRPATMTVETADQVCRAEGERRLAGPATTAVVAAPAVVETPAGGTVVVQAD